MITESKNREQKDNTTLLAKPVQGREFASDINLKNTRDTKKRMIRAKGEKRDDNVDLFLNFPPQFVS